MRAARVRAGVNPKKRNAAKPRAGLAAFVGMRLIASWTLLLLLLLPLLELLLVLLHLLLLGGRNFLLSASATGQHSRRERYHGGQ